MQRVPHGGGGEPGTSGDQGATPQARIGGEAQASSSEGLSPAVTQYV